MCSYMRVYIRESAMEEIMFAPPPIPSWDDPRATVPAVHDSSEVGTICTQYMQYLGTWPAMHPCVQRLLC